MPTEKSSRHVGESARRRRFPRPIVALHDRAPCLPTWPQHSCAFGCGSGGAFLARSRCAPRLAVGSQMERRSRRVLVEHLAWVVGSTAVAIWAFFHFSGTFGERRELSRFSVARAAGHLEAGQPDQTLWSPIRRQAWHDTLARGAPPPLAVLRIPKIGLEVPVLEGTDDWTLNRAVGHIEDTAAPGGDGNSGIAGHRDGFFRGLKDVAVGDALEVETPRGTQ